MQAQQRAQQASVSDVKGKSSVRTGVGLQRSALSDDPGFISCSSQFLLKDEFSMQSPRVVELMRECDERMMKVRGAPIYMLCNDNNRLIKMVCVFSSTDDFKAAAQSEDVLQWFECMREVSTPQMPTNHGAADAIEPVIDVVRRNFGDDARFFRTISGAGFARFSYFQNYSTVAQEGKEGSMILLARYDKLRSGVDWEDAELVDAVKQLAAETSKQEGCMVCVPLYEPDTREIGWRLAFVNADAVKEHAALTHNSDAYKRFTQLCDLENIAVMGPQEQLRQIRASKLHLCQQGTFFATTNGWCNF